MAKGKIIYTPLATRAVSLDGAHYLSLDDAAFNFGVDNFAVDFLFRVDGAVVNSAPYIVSKLIAPAAGWAIFWDKTSSRMGFYLSDGTQQATIYSINGSCPADTDLWVRLAVARSGLVSFTVNNLAAGSGSIAAVSGSLDNIQPLRIGAYSTGVSLFLGTIGFLRIDQGRLLPAAWVEEEWWRLKYGCRRRAQDFLAFWPFYGDSLADLSANAFELTWQGGGDPLFADGWPGSDGSIAYPFLRNFAWGHEPGEVQLDDNQRMADGSAYNYPHPNPKRTFLLPFKNIDLEQQIAFEGAWAGKQPVGLCLDSDRPLTGNFQMMKYPLLKSIFGKKVDAELDLEEV